ncbi:MAG: diaminopimelate epimerase [Bacteroidales bacterium]|nr:diaminopimelate epimerase [Bacteroidales bacterium]
MHINFAKYHGAGNDFILIDNRGRLINPTDNNLIANLCHRHFGIGADGLILLENSKEADFRMVYFNADGYEGTMCGNGGRCVTAFAHSIGLIKEQTRFIASDGIHMAKVLKAQNAYWLVRLSLSDVTSFQKFDDGYFLNTGSPHFVKFVDDAESIDVIPEGKRYRWDERFKPEGTNVNFVEVNKNKLIVKTFERGVEDHTLSCGTGITASALAAAIFTGENFTNYEVLSPGGSLQVSFEKVTEVFTNIILEGPAERSFEGSVKV